MYWLLAGIAVVAGIVGSRYTDCWLEAAFENALWFSGTWLADGDSVIRQTLRAGACAPPLEKLYIYAMGTDMHLRLWLLHQVLIKTLKEKTSFGENLEGVQADEKAEHRILAISGSDHRDDDKAGGWVHSWYGMVCARAV